MPIPDDFNPAQRDAFLRAYKELGEQFTAAVIVVETEVPANEGNRDDCLLYWSTTCNNSQSVGMLERVKKKIME